MRKFISILLLFVSGFILVGCNRTNVTSVEKDIDNIIENYSDSLNGSVKFEQGPEDDLTVTELIYGFKEENGQKKVNGFMAKITNGEDVKSIYIKDNVAYMLLDGQKTKSNLTVAEAKLLIDEYGFEAFIKAIKEIYDENFFKAAKIITNEKEKIVLELDFTKYEGDINKSGEITKFEVVLHYSGKTITKIENKIVRSGVNNIIRVTFNSLKETTIDYPSNLSEYK